MPVRAVRGLAGNAVRPARCNREGFRFSVIMSWAPGHWGRTGARARAETGELPRFSGRLERLRRVLRTWFANWEETREETWMAPDRSTAERAGSPIAETIWVSPTTYLPVRVVVRSPYATPGFQQTADFTWLPPTAQNLAKLTVPVPAGFSQVSLGQAVTPNLKLIPGGPLPKPSAICPSPAGPTCKGVTPPPIPAKSGAAFPLTTQAGPVP
jgi:hypothetical protein